MGTCSRGVRRAVAALVALAVCLVVTPAVADEPPVTVTGRVVDASGVAVAGMEVTLIGGSSSSQETGSDGRFTLGATDGVTGLEIQSLDVAPGQARVAYRSSLTAVGDHELGDVVLPRLPAARLRVVDAAGRAVRLIWAGSSAPVDLLDPDLDWEGAHIPLADGLPLVRARFELQRWTDAAGELVMALPRRVGGGIIDLPVRYQQQFPVEVFGSTADAVEQPDGSFLLTLGMELPVPSAPLTVGALALDGRATVSWAASAPTDPPVPVTYEVKNLASGEIRNAGAEQALTLSLPHGIATSYAVRARSAFGPGPWSAPSTPVTSHATTLRAVSGPGPGAFVIDHASWRLVANQPVRDVRCRVENHPRLPVTCDDLDRVRVSGVWEGRYPVVVTATSVNGSLVRWERTVEGPQIVDARGRQRGWRRDDGGLRSRRQGAWMDLRRTEPGDLHLIARTGPGQGVVEVSSGDRVLRRIDLGTRPRARFGDVTVRLPSAGPRKVRIRVVSKRRVYVKGHAFVR